MSKRRIMGFDAMMRHIRDSGMRIHGSSEKRQLVLTGYFHGYKGYRYNKDPRNRIDYGDYSKLLAVIDYDGQVKATMYRPIMQIETALKSIVADVVLHEAKDDSLSGIMDKLMHPAGHKNTKSFLVKKHQVHDTLLSTLTRNYSSGKEKIVSHYYNKDEYVPIWAIFEVITLGQFGNFVDLLDADIKRKISKAIGIPEKWDANGALVSKIIFALQDFRNAVAHNGTIFDARYHGDRKISESLKTCLEKETGIDNLDFTALVDDIILVLYLQKKLRFKKTPLYSTISMLVAADTDIFKKLGARLYMEIFGSNTGTKLRKMRTYLKSA